MQDGTTVAQEEGDDYGEADDDKNDDADNDRLKPKVEAPLISLPPHLQADNLYGLQILHNTLHLQPTIPGIIAVLQSFLMALHDMLIHNFRLFFISTNNTRSVEKQM